MVLWVHTNGNVTTWLNHWNPYWTSKLKNLFKVFFIWIGCMRFEVLRLSIEPLIGLYFYVSIEMINWLLGWATKIGIEPMSGLYFKVFICIHVKTCFNYWGPHWIKMRSMIHWNFNSGLPFSHLSYWIPEVTFVQFALGHG
jgi:hypothetical protein